MRYVAADTEPLISRRDRGSGFVTPVVSAVGITAGELDARGTTRAVSGDLDLHRHVPRLREVRLVRRM